MYAINERKTNESIREYLVQWNGIYTHPPNVFPCSFHDIDLVVAQLHALHQRGEVVIRVKRGYHLRRTGNTPTVWRIPHQPIQHKDLFPALLRQDGSVSQRDEGVGTAINIRVLLLGIRGNPLHAPRQVIDVVGVVVDIRLLQRVGSKGRILWSIVSLLLLLLLLLLQLPLGIKIVLLRQHGFQIFVVSCHARVSGENWKSIYRATFIVSAVLP
jgi:hypothetical protein